MTSSIAGLRVAGLVVGAVALTGCGSKGGGLPGERQACRAPAGDAAVCGPGLVCMSDVCVRPPPADCGQVAEALVSLEVGNSATREERAAKLPAKRELCEAQRISATEGACLAKATSTWAAGDCVPRLFPEAQGSGCEPVIGKMRSLLASAAGGDPSTAPMIDKAIAVMRASCEEDHWPESLRRCILGLGNDPSDFRACEKATPPELEEKIKARMRAIER